MAASSYDHGASSVPLLGETIGANLKRTVDDFGDREALVSRQQGFRATYSELWQLTTRCAKGLLKRNVKKGDRVGIWAPNRYEWVVVQYATARIGTILVNINPAYLANELGYVLRQSGVRMLLYSEGFRNNRYFIGRALGYTPKDRVCIPVPFYHCFGMVLGNLACTSHGACMVVPSEGFDPLAVMETVQAERCTSL